MLDVVVAAVSCNFLFRLWFDFMYQGKLLWVWVILYFIIDRTPNTIYYWFTFSLAVTQLFRLELWKTFLFTIHDEYRIESNRIVGNRSIEHDQNPKYWALFEAVFGCVCVYVRRIHNIQLEYINPLDFSMIVIAMCFNGYLLISVLSAHKFSFHFDSHSFSCMKTMDLTKDFYAA